MKTGGISVALIGPDGAGKTSVARRLGEALPMPSAYLYMGDNAAATNRSLPTTRAAAALRRMLRRSEYHGPPQPSRESRRRRRGPRAVLRSTKSLARALNQVAEEWYRQFVAWRHQRRGETVIFDRHFFTDYYAYDITGRHVERSLGRRLHGALLLRTYPRPDLVIYLDAPAEVLLARKGEGTVESLERRRRDYLELRDLFSAFEVVDATQPLETVVEQVAAMISSHAARRAAVQGRP